MQVDKAFENLLIDLVGTEVYDTFKRTQTEDWLDLWRDFEVKKRATVPDKNYRVRMKFPISLSETFERVTKGNLADNIVASKYAKDIQFLGGDKIKISVDLFKSLFEISLRKIVDHVSTLLRDENVKKIKAILIVGGYSESPMLQQAIKETFTEINVVIPLCASTSILRGAVIYGYSPISIRERVLKYTYGVGTTRKFKEDIDPEHLQTVTATGQKCYIFSKHVEKGQTVKCNEAQVEKRYRTTHLFQEIIKFPIYASEDKNIRYIDDCKHIGDIELQLPDPEEHPGRQVVVTMTFSGTEIVVKAVDEKTGKDTCVFVNLLE